MAPMEAILLMDLMSVTDLLMKVTIPMALTKVIILMDLSMMEAKNIKK